MDDNVEIEDGGCKLLSRKWQQSAARHELRRSCKRQQNPVTGQLLLACATRNPVVS